MDALSTLFSPRSTPTPIPAMTTTTARSTIRGNSHLHSRRDGWLSTSASSSSDEAD